MLRGQSPFTAWFDGLNVPAAAKATMLFFSPTILICYQPGSGSGSETTLHSLCFIVPLAGERPID
jgi:hypothetical protein